MRDKIVGMIHKILHYILLSALGTTYLLANDVVEHKKLPLSISLPYLETIEDKALTIGNGPVKVFVFIDPLCPHSQNFMSLIYESKKMQARYSYYLFLYALPRFHSERVVSAIYATKNPLDALVDLMIFKKKIKDSVLLEDKSSVVMIADVAQKIDVYKRPYLIMVKPENKKREK